MIDLLLLYVLLAMACASISFVWLNTLAFVEWTKLLFLGKLFYVNEYLAATIDDPVQTYPEYLVFHHNCFLTRMLVCPHCFSYWLTAVINSILFSVITISTFPDIVTIIVIWVLFIPSWLILSYCTLFLHQLLQCVLRARL